MVDGGTPICPLILPVHCATALYILTIQRSCLFQESQFTFLQLLKDNIFLFAVRFLTTTWQCRLNHRNETATKHRSRRRRRHRREQEAASEF